MKSAIIAAALGAAALTQAATIGHKHAHLHNKRHAHGVAERHVPQKRDVSFISDADVALLAAKNILVGKNIAAAAEGTSPVTVGLTGGPFVVSYHNDSPEDIVLIVWTQAAGDYAASFIGTSQPEITHTLLSNTTTWVSFDPASNGGSISGAWGALYPGQSLSWVGQLDNTWGEYTFTTENEFSTTDVSRLINMGGNPMVIKNFGSHHDARTDPTNPACVADMDTCVFTCPDGANTCMVGQIDGCSGANTTSDGVDNGGCSGMPNGGYIRVHFQ